MSTTETINRIEVKAPKSNHSVAIGQFGLLVLLVMVTFLFAITGDVTEIIKLELAWSMGLNLIGVLIIQAVNRRSKFFIVRDESGKRRVEWVTFSVSIFCFALACAGIFTSAALPKLQHETALVYLLVLSAVLIVSLFSPHWAQKMFGRTKPSADPVLSPNQAYSS